MKLIIKEVKSKKDLGDFIRIPAGIHAGHKNWVPPLYSDDWGFFNPKKNRSFGYCDSILLVAYKDGKPAGRIMGLINHRYNKRKNENNARFSYFETHNDPEVFRALLTEVEKWAKNLGAEKIVGPLGFSDKEPQGWLVEGFDEPVVLATNCNFEYQVKLLQAEGYVPEVNLVCYKTVIPDIVPDIYQKVLPRLERSNGEFKLVEFRSRMRVRPYIRPVLHLTNRAFEEIYGSMPYDEKEMDDFANRFLILLNPRFIKVVLNQAGQVIAYLVAMPDNSKGIQKSRGYLFPFGLFQILRSGRKSNRIVMLLGAVDESYRGRGLDVMLALKILDSARKEGKKIMDSHIVMEANLAMRREYERLGGNIYKRYQIFSKSLK